MEHTRKRRNLEPVEAKCYGYVRVSTEEQGENGHSIAAQSDLIYKYADLHDLNIVSIITDVGSGANISRDGVERLNVLVKERKITHLVVTAIDRLSRRVRDLLYLVDEIYAPAGVEFISIREHVDTTSPHGKMFLTLIGSFAELERNLISDRTKTIMANLRENDRRFTRHAPYGYEWRGKKMVKSKDEGKILDKIIELDGYGLTPAAIGADLDRTGMTARNGRPWNRSTIHGILKRYYDEARKIAASRDKRK